MTPDRLAELLGVLHWSVRKLAVVLDEHETKVRRWAAGESVIPLDVAQWLEGRAAPAFKAPLPAGWKTRANRQEAR